MGSLAVITGPTAEPLTLAEARSQVKVTDADSDAKLAALIFAAREWAQGQSRRILMQQTLEYYLHVFPSCEIRLPVGPVQSITSVKYRNTSNVEVTLAAAAYDTDLKTPVPVIAPAYGYTWPDTYDRYNAVTVRFVAGYADQAPELHTVREAMLMWIQAQYDTDERQHTLMMDVAEAILSPLRVVTV